MSDKFNHNHYKTLADSFRYPDQKLDQQTETLLKLVMKHMPGKTVKVQEILETQYLMTLGEQQEYYLMTFDVQAVCCPDLGYLLFGEDYKRAQLLVNLKKEHSLAGVDCGNELGDYLPNILTLLERTTDRNFAEELGFIITIPAVRFMLVKLKNVTNYYKDLLEILLDFLSQDFKGEGLDDFIIPEQLLNENNDFLFQSEKAVLCDLSCKPKSF
ncbi:MAG TPA: hypothetical protein PLB27_08490 [Bacteroidales bacterium]|nr:hypothetical protein [Bacteroidales bacterium]